MSFADELISIIIPAFNAEKTLSRCLDSLRDQDYKVFQAIVIDDGSTDGTYSIAKRYSQFDKRFECHSKQNGGSSSARNYGLGYCAGTYCCFVDSDDYLVPDALSSFLACARENGADYVLARPVAGQANVACKRCNIEDALASILGEYTKGFLWDKFFKTELIRSHGIRFVENIHYGEDLLFCIEYLEFCQHVICFDYCPCVHLGNPDSVTSVRLFRESSLTIFDALDKCANMPLVVGNHRFRIKIEADYAYNCLILIGRFANSSTFMEKHYKRLVYEARRRLRFVLYDSTKSAIDKLRIIAGATFPSMLRWRG